jgi:hypothetical protein
MPPLCLPSTFESTIHSACRVDERPLCAQVSALDHKKRTLDSHENPCAFLRDEPHLSERLDSRSVAYGMIQYTIRSYTV